MSLKLRFSAKLVSAKSSFHCTLLFTCICIIRFFSEIFMFEQIWFLLSWGKEDIHLEGHSPFDVYPEDTPSFWHMVCACAIQQPKVEYLRTQMGFMLWEHTCFLGCGFYCVVAMHRPIHCLLTTGTPLQDTHTSIYLQNIYMCNSNRFSVLYSSSQSFKILLEHFSTFGVKSVHHTMGLQAIITNVFSVSCL